MEEEEEEEEEEEVVRVSCSKSLVDIAVHPSRCSLGIHKKMHYSPGLFTNVASINELGRLPTGLQTF